MARVFMSRHVLVARDLAGLTDHFVQVLGFKRDFAVEGWEFLSLGEFRVMLGGCPDDVPASETGNHSYFAHVLVEDVDTLYNTMKLSGALFYQDIEDKSWGLREYFVVTPEGHRIGFAQEIR